MIWNYTHTYILLHTYYFTAEQVLELAWKKDTLDVTKTWIRNNYTSKSSLLSTSESSDELESLSSSPGSSNCINATYLSVCSVRARVFSLGPSEPLSRCTCALVAADRAGLIERGWGWWTIYIDNAAIICKRKRLSDFNMCAACDSPPLTWGHVQRRT